MADETNQLLRRCFQVVKRVRLYDKKTYVTVPGYVNEFEVDFYMSGGRLIWIVGFYSYHHGKIKGTGSTLNIALRKWLKEWERAWDE